MKKLILVLLLAVVLFAFAGCSEAEPFEAENESQAVIKIKEGSVSNTGFEFTIENTSDDKIYIYNDICHLQKYERGKWVYVKSLLNFIDSNASDILLRPHGEMEQSFYWEHRYGALSSGKYRVVKSVEEMAYDEWLIGNDTEVTEYKIYATFTI